MTSLLVPGVTALADAPHGPDSYPGEFAVTDLPDLPADWLVELGSSPIPSVVGAPSLGQPGVVAVAGVPDAPVEMPTGAVLRFSLRGWIGEPEDAVLPNAPYLERLVEPPTLVRSIRVLPEDSARATFQAGEIALDNADGGLDIVGGDWTMAGRPAVIRRGPHRTPRRAAYSEFGRVADLRITGAALTSGTRLTLGLRAAAADLDVPVCSTYAGTGGLEGDATLAGQSRPLLLGIKRNVEPMPLLATSLVWQVSSAPLAAVLAVRDRGAPLTPGSDYATLPALLAATVAAGSYATCLAQGLIRTGSSPQGQLTLDAFSAGELTHGGIAVALLRGPGGMLDERIVLGGFANLPAGNTGWIWRGGTVSAALDTVLGSCAGWWGSDRLGRITAGRLVRPDLVGPRVTLQRWMLVAEPSEQTGVAPRWRQRVAYRRLDRTQSATDLAGIAASNPALVAAYGTAEQIATAFDTGISQLYPSATDPEPLATGYEDEASAQALADTLLALHGVRRRRWRVPVGKWGNLIDLGDVVAVDHPRLAGRQWVAVAMDQAGDNVTLTLWG